MDEKNEEEEEEEEGMERALEVREVDTIHGATKMCTKGRVGSVW